MSRTLQIGVVTAALALGLLIGAIFFRSRHEEPPRAEKAPRPAPVAAAPAPSERNSAELARANERIAALENQLRSLQEKVESRAKDKEAFLKELKEELAGKTTTVFEGEGDDAAEMPFGWRVAAPAPERRRPPGGWMPLGARPWKRPTSPSWTASGISRRSTRKRPWTATRPGSKSPLPAEGKALIDEWSGRLTALLTPDEKDKYKRLQLGLLPADVGQAETHHCHRGRWQRHGHGDGAFGDGKGFMGSYKGPKDMAMAPYRHLLKN
jgi:hypothetical protein